MGASLLTSTDGWETVTFAASLPAMRAYPQGEKGRRRTRPSVSTDGRVQLYPLWKADQSGISESNVMLITTFAAPLGSLAATDPMALANRLPEDPNAEPRAVNSTQ